MLTLCFRLGLYRFSRNREADKGKNKGKKTGQNEITPGGGMTEICGFMKGNFRLRLLFILWTIRRISWWYRGDNLCGTPVVCSSIFQTSFPWNDSRVPVGHMIYMDTMAGPGLMGIVVPMGQRQQRKYKGENPVTMNRYLSRFEALCNWYNPGKQRLHVHLGDREYRRLLLGVPQTPSFGKMNELFYNNVEKFEVDLRAECSVNASLGIFLWPCPWVNYQTYLTIYPIMLVYL